MLKSKKISIIVPTWNEEGNIELLLDRIHNTLRRRNITYEVIFVDDNSIDNTKQKITELSEKYPVFFYIKKGKKGKAQSLLEGFSYAKYEFVAMIDADLQY